MSKEEVAMVAVITNDAEQAALTMNERIQGSACVTLAVLKVRTTHIPKEEEVLVTQENQNVTKVEHIKKKRDGSLEHMNSHISLIKLQKKNITYQSGECAQTREDRIFAYRNPAVLSKTNVYNLTTSAQHVKGN